MNDAIEFHATAEKGEGTSQQILHWQDSQA